MNEQPPIIGRREILKFGVLLASAAALGGCSGRHSASDPMPTPMQLQTSESSISIEPVPTSLISTPPSLEPVPTPPPWEEIRLMIELPPWLNSGPKEKPRVGLTVDDEFGKEGIDNLEILLNICKEKNVRTTLFPTGGALQTHLDLGRQDVWRRAVAEGHEIGNHTYDHIALDKLSLEAIGAQLARQSEVLDKVLDYPYKMRYARPPGGAGGFNPGTYVDNAINKSGYTATMWSIGGDYADPGADFADAIVNRKNVKNGDIILTHFTTLPVQYFPQVIDGLRAKGLEPTTITGLFVP